MAILYSTGEENSRIQAESAAAAFEAAGLTAESYTANDSNDISIGGHRGLHPGRCDLSSPPIT